MKRFKSKFEQHVSKVLGTKAKYEPDKLGFVQPAVERTYIPDWKIGNGVYIETKGKFTLDDRKKMLWVKEQYPEYTFYLLFQNAHNRITKRSSTTYADWSARNGFQWAHWPDGIPEEWFKHVYQTDDRNTGRGSGIPRKSRKGRGTVSS